MSLVILTPEEVYAQNMKYLQQIEKDAFTLPECSPLGGCEMIQNFLNQDVKESKGCGNEDLLDFLNEEISLEEKWEIKSEGIKDYILTLETRAIILKTQLNDVLKKLDFQKRRLDSEFKELV